MSEPLYETHAKLETDVPTTLEQIWGYNELARYSTTDESAYRERLYEMNRSDLEAHGRALGVVIVESSERLREKLLTEFRRYGSSLYRPAPVPQNQTAPSEAVRKILAEGR